MSSIWKNTDQLKAERRAEVDGNFSKLTDAAIASDERITGLQEAIYLIAKRLGDKGEGVWERALIGPHNRTRVVADGARVDLPGEYKFLTSTGSPDQEGYTLWLREKLVFAELRADRERRARIKAEKELKAAKSAANKALGLHEGLGK